VVTTTTHKTLRGPRGAIIMCKEKYAKQVDRAVFPGLQGGPHDHITAAKAVAFGEALEPEFKVYARQVIENAQTLAEELMKRDYKIISGGTDSHLLVVDLTNKGISGKDAETALDKPGISVSRSPIPNDPRSALDPSGIRLGTPAVTTRGMAEKEMQRIAGLIDDAIGSEGEEAVLKKIKKEVGAMCDIFPAPGIKM
jgi:glycine hydroxymethyltransferase